MQVWVSLECILVSIEGNIQRELKIIHWWSFIVDFYIPNIHMYKSFYLLSSLENEILSLHQSIFDLK